MATGRMAMAPRSRLRLLGWPDRIALTFGLAGLVYRFIMVLLCVPGTDSDEGTVGLAGLHIAQLHDAPVYFYGQYYMGALESYLAAPLFAAFGAGIVALRVQTLLCYAAFVLLMYLLTRRLYTPWLAAFTVGLLALGADRVLKDQLIARGGYAEIRPAAVGLLLLAVVLGQDRYRRRWPGFAAFGFIAGLSLWDDWLILPYLAAAVAVLVAGCWRELLATRVGAVLLAGLVLGSLPMLLGNLTAPAGQNSLAVFLRLTTAGRRGSLGDQLHAGLVVGVPLASGLCAPNSCTAGQEWWALMYLPLLLVGAILAGFGLRRAMDYATRVRYVGRLALVAAAVLTVAAYVRNPAATSAPMDSVRYLSLIGISLPAALWPLWSMALPRKSPVTAAVRLGACAALAALTAAMVLGTGALVAQIPQIRDRERREAVLADFLQRQDIHYVYGLYGSCGQLMFRTRERVVCAAVNEDLTPGDDRYPPYRAAVRAADRPAFVFPVDRPADRTFRSYLENSHISASISTVEGFHVYQTGTNLGPRRG